MPRCKIYVLLIVLLFCNLWANAQIISGKVIYGDTGQPAAGATVYYSGSGIGTITDSLGNFRLNELAKKIPVNASFIGYYTATADYEPGKPFVIRLKPKTEELKTVTIRGEDGMSRKDKERLFFMGFIGTSYTALDCTIMNINDVDLYFDKSTQTLSAFARKPIIVKNPQLGYIIYYYLDRYTAKPGLTTCNGYSRYFEDPTLASLPKTHRHREDAYDGSRIQFIRALWHHTLKKSGFSIYTPDYHKLTEDSIMITDWMHLKDIKISGRVLVNHRAYGAMGSSIYITTDMIYIDKSGYAGDLYYSGYLGKLRLGDELPYDYVSDADKDNFPEFVSEKTKTAQKAAERKQAIKDSIAAARKAAP